MRNKLSEYNFKKLDLLLLVTAILLGCIGAVVLNLIPGVKEDMSVKQMLGVFFGFCLAIFVSLFDYHFIAKFYILLYLLNLAMLILVKFTSFGISVYDSKRWLGIENVFSFQPSELTKIIMIIVIAKFFDLFKERLHKLSTFILAAIIMGIPTVLILIQTDLSTSIVLVACFAVMVFASGYSLKILGVLVSIFIPLFSVLFWYVQQPTQKLLKPYQQKRILSLLNPEAYPDLIYQQKNAVEAISSGGLLGKTFIGDTGIRGTAYVPVIESDFIFTAIGEEFGFIGTAIVILLLAFISFRIILIGSKSYDLMGKIIASGVASIILLQTFVNIGVVSMILPNTGIPLPFVSSGLSSVVGCYSMLGVVLNISINQKIENKRGDYE